MRWVIAVGPAGDGPRHAEPFLDLPGLHRAHLCLRPDGEASFKPPVPPLGMKLNLWLFFFATAAILYPSWPFFVSAWRALKKGT